MEIKNYIESGILESYVMGSASNAEVRELLQLKKEYPEIQQALNELEIDMENIAQHMAITPPPHLFNKIENDINDLIIAPELLPEVAEERHYHNNRKKSQYIEVEAESIYIRIHKAWRWVFAAVFVLGKVFLACAIYYYLENRQAQQQIQQLKTELQQVK